MNPIRFDEEAEEELVAAASWYDAKRPGLGRQLVDLVDEALTSIQEDPAACGFTPHVPRALGVRRKLISRFPYSIVFLELPEEVRILALAHGRRRPGYWRHRIR